MRIRVVKIERPSGDFWCIEDDSEETCGWIKWPGFFNSFALAIAEVHSVKDHVALISWVKITTGWEAEIK